MTGENQTSANPKPNVIEDMIKNDNSVGFTASDVFMAAAKGNLKKLNRIYKLDSSILYHRDENGFVPFHIAALHCNIETLKFFLEKEKEVREQKKDRQDSRETKPSLVTSTSQHGWTPLLLALSAPRSSKKESSDVLECVEFLLDNGADPNAYNDDGSSACHIATSENFPEALRLLMKFHANVVMVDKKGRKPVDIARQRGYKECARIVLAGEWGTSDDYFHNEVTKLAQLKRYRDELRRELDIISLFEADLERSENFKDWLQSKGFSSSLDGPPTLLSSVHAESENVIVTHRDVEKTRHSVFGSAQKSKRKSESLKKDSQNLSIPISAPPKHSSSICKVCSGPVSPGDKEACRGNSSKKDIELPNLRSSLIESVLFGSSIRDTNPPAGKFFQSNSLLDSKKRRPVDKTRGEFAGSAEISSFHSQVGDILRENPPLDPKTKQFILPNQKNNKESDTILNKAAQIPITWKGKPSTVKDYLLEKSYIC